LILDGSPETRWNNARFDCDSSASGADGVWPIDPDPRFTNLRGRQNWHLRDGRTVATDVAGQRIGADDARIALLGIRRDSRAEPFPVAFAHAPSTGEALGPPVPRPDPALLDIDGGSAVEVPLPSGRPLLFRAGRPAGLYLLHDNLGALEAWTGRGFSALGRLPVSATGPALAVGPEGVAYTTATALVSLTLPQFGPGLAHGAARMPGLRFLSAPCWRGADLLAWAERDGWLVRCRGTAGSDGLDLFETGRRAPGGRFSGPWVNRLGDAIWTESDGFVTCDAGDDGIRFDSWPDGFSPILNQAPWRDRADVPHQLGSADSRYHVAALSRDATLQRLDGPHLTAGTVTYWGDARFAAPWQAPAESLNLGGHAGSLLVPVLAMPRDTVLLALRLEGQQGGFIRGALQPGPVTGHLLHHAHGAGLRRLPVSLDVCAIGDPGALLHDGALYLWSRSSGRCHTLRLRSA